MFNKQKVIQTALTVDTNAYTANDVVGGLITFDVSNSAGSGTIRSLKVVDADNEKAALNFYFYNELPSTIADDAAFAPTLADTQKLIGKISVGTADYESLTSDDHAYALLQGDDAPDLDFQTDTGNIYAYMVAVATPTYTATDDLTVELVVWLDG